MEFEGSNILRKTSWYLGHLALSYIYLVDTENAECANCNIKDEQVRFLQLYFSWQWHNVCFPFNLYGALVLFIRCAKNLEILFIWAKFFGTSHRWRTFFVVETRKLKFSSISGCQAVILFPTFSYYFLLFHQDPTFSYFLPNLPTIPTFSFSMENYFF